MPYQPRAHNVLLSLAFIILAVWLALIVILYFLQDQLIFLPTNTLASRPSAIGLEYEDVILKTPDDVELHGWYVPAENSRGVVLFLHGNAGNVSHRLASLEIFNQLDLSTFIIDYRGYGESKGTPSEQGFYTDAETAWNYLTMQRGHKGQEIIIFGRSIGGAVAAWLAARVQPAGVILESTFTSLTAMARKHYPLIPVDLLLRSRFPTQEYLPAVDAPILIIHSRDDELVPYTHAESLYAAADASRQLHNLEGGHNEGFLLSGKDYAHALQTFIDKAL